MKQAKQDMLYNAHTSRSLRQLLLLLLLGPLLAWGRGIQYHPFQKLSPSSQTRTAVQGAQLSGAGFSAASAAANDAVITSGDDSGGDSDDGGPRQGWRHRLQDRDERPHRPHTLMHFGQARVAMVHGEVSLGEHMWSCHQVENVALQSSTCTAAGQQSPGGQQQQQQQQEEDQKCAFLELGGPGLCALDLAKRRPSTRVNLYPSSRRLAELSLAATGGLELNLQLEADLDQYDKGRPVVLQINMLRDDGGNSLSYAGMKEAARSLLSKGVVCAAVMTLQAVSSTRLQQQFIELVGTAVSSGFSAFWGGFDGQDITGDLSQVLRKQQFGHRSVNIFLLPGGADTKEAPSRPPPPTLHVLVPLRPQREENRHGLTMVLCRFLLDTAAASNLSSVHVVGLTANGTHLYHSISTIQKLMVLQYALEGPDPSSGMRPWADISPSDVVMVIDATDTMSQLTSEEFLQRYLDAGAPVFHVSAEVNIWPPPVRNYARLYEEAGVTSVPLPNKYLNSGCFIGRAMVLKKYVQDAVEFVTTSAMSDSSWLFRQQVNYVDDQGVMSFAYLMGNPYGISLDHESAFFYSLYCATEHLVLSCGAIMYNLTSTKVGILHGNGCEGKARLEDVRGGILGDYKADPEFRFLVDGVVTRHGDVCVDVRPMVVGRPAVQCPPGGSQPEHTYTTRSVAPEDCPARGRDGKPSEPRG